MRLTLIVLLSAFLAVGSGCMSHDAGSAAGGGGRAPVESNDATIRFAHDGILPLAPGQSAELEVITDPPAGYALSFLLLGDALDGSLDRTTVHAGSHGRASITLKAPSIATSFVLRASIKGGESADLPVAVSDQGFGSVEIVPTYNGERDVTTWHAGLLSGKTCNDLAEVLPQDPEGALSAFAPRGSHPMIDVAPVGPNLAVYVRAGHYIVGCSDETGLKPGGTATVEVQVVNVPIDHSEMFLAMDLAFSPEPTPWSTLLADGESTLYAELGATTPTEELLLLAMKSVSADPASFESASLSNDWLTSLADYFAQQQIDLVGTLAVYADAGLSAQPPLITGGLEAIENEQDHALFTLKSVGNVSPASLGVPEDYVVTFQVDPNDLVHLGGSLFFFSGGYVARAIASESLAQNPQADELVDVLDDIVGCDQLPLTGMTGCAASCITNLCRDGLELMWQKARVSTQNGPPGEIAMQASGAAAFDDAAALTGFDGMWVGNVTQSGVTAKVTGALSATLGDLPR